MVPTKFFLLGSLSLQLLKQSIIIAVISTKQRFIVAQFTLQHHITLILDCGSFKMVLYAIISSLIFVPTNAHAFLVASRPLERGPRPPHACRAEKRRDLERSLNTVRYVDESDAQRSHPDKCRTQLTTRCLPK